MLFDLSIEIFTRNFFVRKSKCFFRLSFLDFYIMFFTQDMENGHDYTNGNLTRLFSIQHQEFWLKIDKLTVQTKEERPWYRRKATKPSVTILDNGKL